MLDADKGFVSGVSLNLRNRGVAVLKNIDTRGHQNLYFKHAGRKPNTKIIFRKDSPKGEILGSIVYGKEKRGLKNRFSIIRIKKQKKPFDLYIEARNNGLKTNNVKGYDYKDIATQIDWIAFLPDFPASSSEEHQKIKSDF